MEPFDFESDKKAVKVGESRQSQEGQSLLQTIIMIVGAVILVILLVLFARWLYHKAHHSTQVTPASSQQPAGQPHKSTGGQPAANSEASNNHNTPGSPSSPAQNNGLPNSGPGNVLAIFAASSLAAAGLHFIISLRRSSKTSA